MLCRGANAELAKALEEAEGEVEEEEKAEVQLSPPSAPPPPASGPRAPHS